MIVSPDFRRNGEQPPILVLHKARLVPDEILHERGFAFTTPTRAVLDAAGSGDASREMIRQAFAAGKSRGLITRRDIATALNKASVDAWLRKALQAA